MGFLQVLEDGRYRSAIYASLEVLLALLLGWAIVRAVMFDGDWDLIEKSVGLFSLLGFDLARRNIVSASGGEFDDGEDVV